MESFSRSPAHHSESALTEFTQAFAYSAIESPLLGIAQLTGNGNAGMVEKVFGDLGIRQSERSGLAQDAGSTLGSIADIMLLNRAVKGVLPSAVPDAASVALEGPVGLTLKQAAITGGIYGSVFTPSNPQGNLLKDRLLSGIAGATTFAGLAGTSLGLQRVAESDAGAARLVAPLLKNPISNGILSGVPAGVFSTYAQVGINQGRVASLGEVGKSVAENSLLGGAFGAADIYGRPRRLGPEVAVTLGGGFGNDGLIGPETTLRAQAAARLAQEHPQMKIILSGDGRPPALQSTRPTEAQLMADILEQNGVASKRLLQEDQSMDTIGNAVLTTARYLNGQKPGKLFVVTSPFHAERAVLSFQGVLGPRWQIEPVVSAVGYRDAARRATESGGVDWTKRFYEGTTPGNIAETISRLQDRGKPVYRNLQWLQNVATQNG